MTIPPNALRPLPAALRGLHDLARDLRWSAAQPALSLWPRLDPALWQSAPNPQILLAQISQERLEAAAQDGDLAQAFQDVLQARAHASESAGWLQTEQPDNNLKGVAYFSLEYGLSAALPLYAGGLGILAGDLLKTASDLHVPVTGVGLLYAHGYFRQTLTPDGWQGEDEVVNDPGTLPISPVYLDGKLLRIRVTLPGRILTLRVWRAEVGTRALYLLDSNDPDNTPEDRAITASLYADDRELRILQELTLAVGGWDTLAALQIPVDVCHLNEGHAAFVVLCRAVRHQQARGVSFDEALFATRPGNLFTTHTPVTAGFDRFEPKLAAHYLGALANEASVPVQTFLDLGHDPHTAQFSMAALAVRGCGAVNAVSALHRDVSRELFASLYPRLPLAEVPVGCVTNGIHPPTWNSDWAQALPDNSPNLVAVPDAELWALRNQSRAALVDFVRARFARQVQDMGLGDAALSLAQNALSPDALTVGFARRFAAYKRPDLLLHDINRLVKVLGSVRRPVQIVVAGKAPRGDDGSKHLVQAMVQASLRPDLFGRLVFLADYDMDVAHALASGADVWLNTPRRPQEACGTSGMKALANGGLNLSSRDGWWAEAYQPDLGWALGNPQTHGEDDDAQDADQLLALLENELRVAFYTRDAQGLPPAWLARMRRSMADLAPRFSSVRMLREYAERCYLPAVQALRTRAADDGLLAKDLLSWHGRLEKSWPAVRLADLQFTRQNGEQCAEVSAFLGELSPDDVSVELYAEAAFGHPPARLAMTSNTAKSAPDGSRAYSAALPPGRPASDYTPRVVPRHPHALSPQEAPYVTWLAR